MTDKEFAATIVTLSGGKENIVKAVNCMTRCRMTLRSADKVKADELKNTEGVLGYVADDNAIQIILGPGKAKKVTDAAHISLEQARKEAEKQLRTEVGDLALQIAEKVIRRNIANDEAQRALVDQYLKEVETNNN